MKLKSYCYLLALLIPIISCKKESTATTANEKPEQTISAATLARVQEIKTFLNHLDGLPADQRDAELKAFISKGRKNPPTGSLTLTSNRKEQALLDPSYEELSGFYDPYWYPSETVVDGSSGTSRSKIEKWEVCRNTYEWWKVISFEHLQGFGIPGVTFTAATHQGSHIEGTTLGIIGWSETSALTDCSPYTAYAVMDGTLSTPLGNPPIHAEKYFPITYIFP